MTELSSQSPSIQTIYGWYRAGKLVVNRAYQRKLVWTLAERQKLIDSIEKRYPIPLILLAEPEGSDTTTYEILDGLQRLHTILSYIENGFADENGKFFNVDEFPTAKEAADSGLFSVNDDGPFLTRSEVSTILDYSLSISIIQKASQNVITDVFGRINTYGHRLSDQEQRQAGQLTELARFVRKLSSEIRGDVSVDILPLHDMPEISIDLPKSRAGYAVKADEVWWVKQGVLRSTDLRDSMDEQLLADLSICLVDQVMERSKDALDRSFDPNHADGQRISASLTAHGTKKLSAEIKYCLEVIGSVVAASEKSTLSRLVFEQSTNNSFATFFVGIAVAVAELVFKDQLLPADYESIAKSLNNIQNRMSNLRTAEARRANINTIKGCIRDGFASGDIAKVVFSGNREFDLRNTLKRSKIELAHFELKQGICEISPGKTLNPSVFEKVNETICAIANNAIDHDGVIVIGVADNDATAQRVADLYAITPAEVSGRFILGVKREADALNITLEQYFQKWRDSISNSKMPETLKTAVLSKLSLCEIGGFDVIVISIPRQRQPSFLSGRLFIRKGDQTVEATAEAVMAVAARF